MLNRLKCTVFGLLAMVVVFPLTLFAAEPTMDTRAQDTVAIQQLVVKYAHAYDSLDVEGYVGVFAEDAKFTFTNTTLNGRADIRKFITDAKQRSASAPAKVPPTKSFHSLTNTLIEFTGPNTAHHRSYWQMLSGPQGGPFTVTNMGYYDDVVIKKNGQWLIQTRNIP